MTGATPNTALAQWLHRPRRARASSKPDPHSRSKSSATQTGRSGRAPFLLETSLQGVFATGDVRSGSVKRVASAVGDGSIAVSFVHQVLAQQGAVAGRA